MLHQEVKTQNQSIENQFQKENIMQAKNQQTLSLSVISEDTFHNAVSTFRNAVKDPDNKPSYDDKYGTKYNGKIRFEHFIFYALLRGVDVRKTTHNVTSEKFVGILRDFEKDSETKVDEPKRIINSIKSEFGLSNKQMMDILNANYKNIFEVLES